jgi:hypothetical protein
MALEVSVNESITNVSVIDHTTLAVTVSPAVVEVSVGSFLPVPGPAGPAGGVIRYVHTQSTASTTWTVNHNLGSRPLIAVFSAGGVEVDASILHISNNQAQISFNTAVTGTATCV